MPENKVEAQENPLEKMPTSALITELGKRNLTSEQIGVLHSLKIAESQNNLQITISESPQEENQTLVDKFAKAVIRKNVHTKLQKGSRIDGVEVNPEEYMGFCDYGQRLYPAKDSEINQVALSGNWEHDPVGRVSTMITAFEKSLPADLLRSQILSVVPLKGGRGNKEVLNIHCFQDHTEALPNEKRGGNYIPANLQVELPKEVMAELLNEIAKNPDLLEDFYQKVFSGLDGKDNSPGIRRLKVDGFYLLTNPPARQFAQRMMDPKFYYPTYIRGFFEKLEKFKYKNGPYGSGRFYESKT